MTSRALVCGAKEIRLYPKGNGGDEGLGKGDLGRSLNRLEDDDTEETQEVGSPWEGPCHCGVLQRGWGLRLQGLRKTNRRSGVPTFALDQLATNSGDPPRLLRVDDALKRLAELRKVLR